MPNSMFLAASFVPLQIIQIPGNKYLKMETLKVAEEIS